jgi:hypothetical protein
MKLKDILLILYMIIISDSRGTHNASALRRALRVRQQP